MGGVLLGPNYLQKSSMTQKALYQLDGGAWVLGVD
jgi:hypothetical protein